MPLQLCSRVGWAHTFYLQVHCPLGQAQEVPQEHLHPGDEQMSTLLKEAKIQHTRRGRQQERVIRVTDPCFPVLRKNIGWRDLS